MGGGEFGSAPAQLFPAQLLGASHWEQVIADYRIYLITKDNHIACAPVKIDCDNDLIAVQQSQKLLAGQDIQLWEGRRLVTRLKAEPP